MRSKSLQNILKEPSVIFDEAAHTYKHKESGDFYTGCTTISEAWDKSFFLGPWHAKEAIAEVKAKLPEIARLIQDNPKPEETPALLKLLDECKGAARRKGDKAKEDGTLAHAWFEGYVNAQMSDEVIPSTPDAPEAKNAVLAFCGWLKTVKGIVWLASEEVLASDEYRVAGMLDAIATIDGLPYLVDFKTSSQLSPSYLLQCAGYDLMLREMGFTVAGYIIVRTPKDGSKAETLTITNRDDMQFFRETFLKQREAHKFYVYAESKFKDETGKMKVDEKVENQNTN